MYAFIADLHLGTKLPQIDYLKSLNEFLCLIKKHKEECHAIFVLGDLFDHRLTIEESKFAATFLVNLVCNNCGRNAQEENVPVHFIHGTYSHDNDQYEIYLNMLSRIEDTDIFYTKIACKNILETGAKVLYLPQEYQDNSDYERLLNEEYDIIIGHGPMSSKTKSPCPHQQSEILHSVEQLGSISKICVFGHYHEYTDFGNNVYYAGPWLQWKYGEDAPNVFFMCDDNFNVQTVLNPYAMKYETIEINSPEELRNALSVELTNPHRFIIKCKNDELNDYHGIMNMHKRNQFIKYNIITEDVKNEDMKKIASDKTITKLIEPIPSLISYIKAKYDVDASDEIKEYENKINRDKKE